MEDSFGQHRCDNKPCNTKIEFALNKHNETSHNIDIIIFLINYQVLMKMVHIY